MRIEATVPFLLLLTSLALYDCKYRRIPNVVVIPALGMAILIRILLQDLPISESILGFLLAGTTFYVGALFDKMGGWDVKLMALVGWVLGVWHVLNVLVLASLFLLVTWLIRGNRPVPFAPYVLVSVIIFYIRPIFSW